MNYYNNKKQVKATLQFQVTMGFLFTVCVLQQTINIQKQQRKSITTIKNNFKKQSQCVQSV